MRELKLASLCVLLCLLACQSEARSSNPQDYVGKYVHVPIVLDTDGFAETIVLRPDSTAVQIRIDPSSGKVTSSEVRWSLISYPSGGMSLGVGGFSHSIKGTREDVRLTIDPDLDIYYKKLR